jgi:hypothetical protein
MSLEIPNALAAMGIFNPAHDPNNPNPFFPDFIPASAGIQPYNPSTSPTTVLGGLTRVA